MGYSAITHALIDYVESHLESFGIKEMSGHFGFSEQYLRELFLKNVKVPVMRYYRRRRIVASAFEILHSDKKIVDIALERSVRGQGPVSLPGMSLRAMLSWDGISSGMIRNLRKAFGLWTTGISAVAAGGKIRISRRLCVSGQPSQPWPTPTGKSWEWRRTSWSPGRNTAMQRESGHTRHGRA